MTRTGPTKRVPKGFGEARLRIARAYLKGAQEQTALASDADIGNPIVSQIVSSAIAVADALTAMRSDRINQKDHNATAKNLRSALGDRLPKAQVNRLSRILVEKDAAQYGISIHTKAEALRLLSDLERFAEWAENEARRSD
jgi:hypothetical protein